MTGVGTYPIGGLASGRYAEIYDTFSTLLAQTAAVTPGTLTVTGIDLTDSIVAGRFAITLNATADSSPYVTLKGSFRLPFRIVGSGNFPDGTPCYGAT
jgi:hypothetical protein